jgi:DNA adenine methylase
MTHETLLRYPGGKSRAVKHILPHLPSSKLLFSPFIGGGYIELAWLKADRNRVLHAFDIYRPLVSYWQCLLDNPELLYHRVCLHKGINKELFKTLQYDLPLMAGLDQAAAFFALNRSSFSGLTSSGGMSPGTPRFNSSILQKLKKWDNAAVNLTVNSRCFTESIPMAKDYPLYLDPPYMISSSNLYGDRGSTHKDFDHLALFELLKDRPNWVMSYNGSLAVRDLYKGFDVVDLYWAYGMNNKPESSEILIKSKLTIMG